MFITTQLYIMLNVSSPDEHQTQY